MNPMLYQGNNADATRDPYASSGRTFRILCAVLILHSLIFILPWLWMKYQQWKNPPVIVVRAALVELPKGTSLDVPKKAEPAPADDPAPQQKEENLLDSLPEVDPLPPLLDPPPQPEVKPQPKPKPVPKPEVKPQPKPVPKPEVKPQPKPKPVVKPQPKPVAKPKPEPQEKKYLTAEDIKKLRKKNPKRVIKEDTQAKKRAEAEARKQRQQAEARQRQLDAVATAAEKYGSPQGGEKGIPATKEYYDYIDKLTALIRRQWKEPRAIELGASRVSVVLTLEIAADGTVKTKNFKPSGIEVMDRSVRDLLEKLRVVTPPPRGPLTVPVTLRVSD